MTTKKYVKIKETLSALMKEFEDVPEHEQKRITGLTVTVQEQLSYMSTQLNRLNEQESV